MEENLSGEVRRPYQGGGRNLIRGNEGNLSGGMKGLTCGVNEGIPPLIRKNREISLAAEYNRMYSPLARKKQKMYS